MSRIYMIVSFLFAILFTTHSVYSQCTVTATASDYNTVCGDCISLIAFGQGQGQSVFTENFNNGQPNGWSYTQQAMFNNPCSPNGVDGTTHIWMGNSSAVPRAMETLAYNLLPATAGVTVCFDMLFSVQADAAPCEGPDEPDEGVYIQYSTNGGANWTTIHYFDPNGGNDPQLVNWNNWCFALPPAAISANTQIRWFQDNDSGADFDHWGIDNVIIYFNDPTFNITWLHDSYSYGTGNSGGANPNLVCPNSDTTFIVMMTNGFSTCYDTVSIDVTDPQVLVNAWNDTSICPGSCVPLNGSVTVIEHPAQTPTYGNYEFQAVASAFGSNTEINVNITDLNMTNILPNSITEVCIDGLSFFGTTFFPPSQISINALEVNLVCPSGQSITLVPSGQTSSSGLLSGYINTCFVPAGGGNIAAASEPYTGNFAPNQPFNNLAGCQANGVWTLQVQMTSLLGFGQGLFTGWSITFADPEVSYAGGFAWSPTAGMTNANTLNPTVCPTTTTTYTLSAFDTAGCVTVTDIVTVTTGQSIMPDTCTWAGGIDDNWFNACNWVETIVPDLTAHALIPGGTPNQPRIFGGTAQCQGIIVRHNNLGHNFIDVANGGFLMKQP